SIWNGNSLIRTTYHCRSDNARHSQSRTQQILTGGGRFVGGRPKGESTLCRQRLCCLSYSTGTKCGYGSGLGSKTQPGSRLCRYHTYGCMAQHSYPDGYCSYWPRPDRYRESATFIGVESLASLQPTYGRQCVDYARLPLVVYDEGRT